MSSAPGKTRPLAPTGAGGFCWQLRLDQYPLQLSKWTHRSARPKTSSQYYCFSSSRPICRCLRLLNWLCAILPVSHSVWRSPSAASGSCSSGWARHFFCLSWLHCVTKGHVTESAWAVRRHGFRLVLLPANLHLLILHYLTKSGAKGTVSSI